MAVNMYSSRLLSWGLRDAHKARALITTLLSTTAVAAAHSSRASTGPRIVQNSHVKQPSPTAACCYPATYSSLASHWTRQSCLASDLLELHHTAKYTGQVRPVPSRPLTSGYSSDEEEVCLQWYDIDTPEFAQLVDGKKLQLFDVREPEELEETGIIPGAVNLPLGEVEEALALTADEFEEKYRAKKPSKEDTNIVFHCRAGVRSLSALQSAHQMGYSKARHYVRGWLGWADHLQQS